jgi:hypothetical protein
MYIGLHVNYPSFLSDFNDTWTFSTDFGKTILYQNSMKNRPVGAELFNTEGQTDERASRRTGRNDNANSPLSQFRERARNVPVF